MINRNNHFSSMSGLNKYRSRGYTPSILSIAGNQSSDKNLAFNPAFYQSFNLVLSFILTSPPHWIFPLECYYLRGEFLRYYFNDRFP